MPSLQQSPPSAANSAHQLNALPRLCHLRKWSDFDGYGFTLREDKLGPRGHYVSAVEAHSPAESVGLKTGQRVVEINGTNIAGENHRQVVLRIQAVPTETKLLVVDPDSESYYAGKKLVVSGSMPDVQVSVCPLRNPYRDEGGSSKNEMVGSKETNIRNNEQAGARLCTMVRDATCKFYGFTMHQIKNRKGHFVGNVEPNSPAEAAGLKVGDSIIEVNEINVVECSHEEVAERVNSRQDSTSLLVVDMMVNAPGVQEPSESIDVGPVKHANQELPTGNTTSNDATSKETISLDKGRNLSYNNNKTNGDINETIPHTLRLCHLHLWPDFPGYGFTMHLEREREGQYVGKVHPNSPADAGGLKEGDRIIEVNGVNVEHTTHQDVADKVRAGQKEATILVVDAEADRYFREHSLPLSSDQPNVSKLECPKKSLLADQHHDVVVIGASNEYRSDNSEKAVKKSRVCHLQLSPVFRGYGFTMHLNKDRLAHMVGKVEPKSPSEAGGLTEGSRIIEVNGVNVEQETHETVADLIRQSSPETKLLVEDCKEGGENHAENGSNIVSTDKITPVIQPPSIKLNKSNSREDRRAHPFTLRRCRLKTWPKHDGYGFMLATGKDDLEHYLSRVDPGSPAEAGGLRLGDRLIEVNGANVERATHVTVINRVKEHSERTELVVVDILADAYFKENNLPLSGDQQYVVNINCPSLPPKGELSRKESTLLKNDSSLCFPHKLRLCSLKPWPDGAGSELGFTVHTDRDRPGQFIGKVDAKSPAEYAGLREGDRIIELNDLNVEKDFHRELSEKIRQAIRSGSGYIKLLVVDAEADRFFSERHAQLSSTQSFVEKLSTPAKRPKSSLKVSSSHPPLPNPIQPYTLRLCHLKIWPSFPGYGFTMHQNQNFAAHFVGKVESDSPSRATGLLEGDRIVEVNGLNVENVEHDEVVQRIRAAQTEGDGSTSLLVVEQAADEYFSKSKLKLSSRQPFVKQLVCPDRPPAAVTESGKSHEPQQPSTPVHLPEISRRPQDLTDGNRLSSLSPPHTGITASVLPSSSAGSSISAQPSGLATVSTSAGNAHRPVKTNGHERPMSWAPTAAAILDMKQRNRLSGSNQLDASELRRTAPVHMSTPLRVENGSLTGSGYRLNGSDSSGLQLAGSAKEARARMPKKSNVKDVNLSLKEKFELFEML